MRCVCFLAGLGSAMLVWGEHFKVCEQEVQVEGIPEYLPGKAVSVLLGTDNSGMGEENLSSVRFLGEAASVPTAGKATAGQCGHPPRPAAAHSCLYHSCTTPFLLTKKKESIHVIPKFQMSAFQPSRKADHQAAWWFVASNSVIDSSSKPFLRTSHAPTIVLGIGDADRVQIWGLMFINHLQFWRSSDENVGPPPQKTLCAHIYNVLCL